MFLNGSADDAAVVISAYDIKRAQIRLKQMMRREKRWMEEHELKLSPAETETVMLNIKRIFNILHI